MCDMKEVEELSLYTSEIVHPEAFLSSQIKINTVDAYFSTFTNEIRVEMAIRSFQMWHFCDYDSCVTPWCITWKKPCFPHPAQFRDHSIGRKFKCKQSSFKSSLVHQIHFSYQIIKFCTEHGIVSLCMLSYPIWKMIEQHKIVMYKGDLAILKWIHVNVLASNRRHSIWTYVVQDFRATWRYKATMN